MMYLHEMVSTTPQAPARPPDSPQVVPDIKHQLPHPLPNLLDLLPNLLRHLKLPQCPYICCQQQEVLQDL
jgi:hypothetical protein